MKAQKIQMFMALVLSTVLSCVILCGCNHKKYVDFEKASIAELITAAKNGSNQARVELGRRYLEGNGILQDKVEALKWFKMAADQGDSSAESNLGLCYQHGNGVVRDDNQAVKWFENSANQGNPSRLLKNV
jgi:TPR repeat protein